MKHWLPKTWLIFYFATILTGCEQVKDNPIINHIVIDKNNTTHFYLYSLQDSIIFPVDLSFNEYTDSFGLDIDQDEVDDFTFILQYKRNFGTYQVNLVLRPDNGSKIAADESRSVTGLYPAVPFSPLDTINNEHNWINEPVLMYELSADELFPVIGFCFNLPCRFIAIKVKVKLKEHFGWIHFSTHEHYLVIGSFALSRFQAAWW